MFAKCATGRLLRAKIILRTERVSRSVHDGDMRSNVGRLAVFLVGVRSDR